MAERQHRSVAMTVQRT